MIPTIAVTVNWLGQENVANFRGSLLYRVRAAESSSREIIV